MTPITIKSSRFKYAVLLLIAIFGFLIGAMMVTDAKAKNVWTGWGCLVFCGVCVSSCARQLFDLRPRLILNDEGIFDRTLGVGIIPWSEITGTTLRSVHRQHFICLDVRNPERWIARLPPLKRAVVSVNKALGFATLNLNLSAIAADPMEVYAHVLKKAVASRTSND